MSQPLPSRLVGRYQLSRRLGEGSFAETFLATDTLLQRQVAVKILREQYARDPRFATRFAREAQAAAAVSHPNVVEVYDYGQEAETLFIVMEWVDGADLKQLIREQAPVPVPEAIRLVRELLRGLAVIHQAGIIHRDVKPQNVLVTRQGRAKLTDFGIARGTVASSLTETGMALGTAAYMAPEQASGKPVGPGVDLYAAGVILFELVTGRLPFPGENPVEVMYRQVHEPPPRPGELNRAIGPELEGVILRALAKEPAERYPTAEAMEAALAGIGAAEATRALNVDPFERTARFDSPFEDVPRPAGGMARERVNGLLARPTTWAAGILVAFSLVGLILLSSFRGDGGNARLGNTGAPSSPVSISATPPPSASLPTQTTPSQSPSPSPTPEPSPTPSPTPDPTDELPPATPAPPSPNDLPDSSIPDSSISPTHLLEREDAIRSDISRHMQDSGAQFPSASPGQ